MHHALCNVIEPIFERRFIHDSYANRVGKGTHRAIDKLQAFAQRYRYVMRLDIVQHFPSIDHAVLKRELFQVLEEDIHFATFSDYGSPPVPSPPQHERRLAGTWAWVILKEY